jgi:hypothetical protein
MDKRSFMAQKNSILLYQVAKKSFEEATEASLGATFHTIIAFHLTQKFGKDPYEVLIANPHLFYEGLKEILGEGAEAVVTLAGTYLGAKYKIAFTSQEFTTMFTENNDASTQNLSAIFRTVIEQEEQKLRKK